MVGDIQVDSDLDTIFGVVVVVVNPIDNAVVVARPKDRGVERLSEVIDRPRDDDGGGGGPKDVGPKDGGPKDGGPKDGGPKDAAMSKEGRPKDDVVLGPKDDEVENGDDVFGPIVVEDGVDCNVCSILLPLANPAPGGGGLRAKRIEIVLIMSLSMSS